MESISTTPALEAPAGQTSNLVDSESKATSFVVAIALCLAVSTIACGIRVFTRAYVMRQMKLEDYSLIIAVLFQAAYASLILRGLHFGEGQHLWDVSAADAQEFANLGNIGEILYSPAMFFAKLSAMIWVNTAFYLSIFIALIFACVPREKLWNPTIEGRCINTNSTILATSAINIVSDWSILILPALTMNRLRMNAQKKLRATAIFSVGLLACVASIVRLVYSVKFTQTSDATWAIAPVSVWSYAEIATVILSCGLPILPEFINFLRFGDKQPNTIHSNVSAGSRLKPTMRNRNTRDYLLDDDLASGTKINIEMDTGNSTDLKQGIRKTITVRNEFTLEENGKMEPQYPWRE